MTITAELFDGTKMEFPDGTDPSVIARVAKEQTMARKASAKPSQSPQLAAELSKLSGMSQNPEVAPKPRGFGATMYDNFIGSDDGVNSVGEKIATLLNMGGESLTFGTVGDEAAAGADTLIGRGGGYDANLAKYRGKETQMREDNPLLSLGADVAPALLSPIGALKAGGKLGLRVAKSAGLTGAISGLFGFTDGEGGFENRMQNGIESGAVGTGLGALIPVAGVGVQKYMQGRANKSAVTAAAKGAPSTDELRTAGNAAYKAVDDAGVQIRPEAFDRARGSILDDLRANTGFDELPGPGSLTPNSARVNEIMGQSSARMAADPTAGLPFKALDQMRRQAGAAAGNVANKTDQKAGVSIIQGLDDFVGKLGADDVVAGDIAALQNAIPKARETWSRMTKSQKIDDAIDAGGDYLSGGSSGIRNQFKNILRNPKSAKAFSDAEKAAMRRVVNGSIPEQLLNLAGGGLVQMATAGAGLGLGGFPGFLLGTSIAAGTRKLAEKVTAGKAETVRAMIANGGMKSFPQASQLPRDIIEKLMRQGTATSLRPQ